MTEGPFIETGRTDLGETFWLEPKRGLIIDVGRDCVTPVSE